MSVSTRIQALLGLRFSWQGVLACGLAAVSLFCLGCGNTRSESDVKAATPPDIKSIKAAHFKSTTTVFNKDGKVRTKNVKEVWVKERFKYRVVDIDGRIYVRDGNKVTVQDPKARTYYTQTEADGGYPLVTLTEEFIAESVTANRKDAKTRRGTGTYAGKEYNTLVVDLPALAPPDVRPRAEITVYTMPGNDLPKAQVERTFDPDGKVFAVTETTYDFYTEPLPETLFDANPPPGFIEVPAPKRP